MVPYIVTAQNGQEPDASLIIAIAPVRLKRVCPALGRYSTMRETFWHSHYRHTYATSVVHDSTSNRAMRTESRRHSHGTCSFVGVSFLRRPKHIDATTMTETTKLRNRSKNLERLDSPQNASRVVFSSRLAQSLLFVKCPVVVSRRLKRRVSRSQRSLIPNVVE
jgi:hypothetical protein